MPEIPGGVVLGGAMPVGAVMGGAMPLAMSPRGIPAGAV